MDQQNPHVVWRQRRKTVLVEVNDTFSVKTQYESPKEIEPTEEPNIVHDDKNPITSKWIKAWLDDNPEFVFHYFVRNATERMVEEWSKKRIIQSDVQAIDDSDSDSNKTPVFVNPPSSGSYSSKDFERAGLVTPIVKSTGGRLTFVREDNYEHCPYCRLRTPTKQCEVCGKNENENDDETAAAVEEISDEPHTLDGDELIYEFVKDICDENEFGKLCLKILQHVTILLSADRSSLFLIQDQCYYEEIGTSKCLVSEVFDVNATSTMLEQEQQEMLIIPWGTGIVGYVAETGKVVNIQNAYKDEHFNSEVDARSGYVTKTLVCMPIKDSSGKVIAVSQAVNKINDQPFTKKDEKIFATYLQFCGIGLRNAQLYKIAQLEVKRNQILLDLAQTIFADQSTIDKIVPKILLEVQKLIECERAQILLLEKGSKHTFWRIFNLNANQVDCASKDEKFPINIGITGHVAATGETINIKNAYKDPRFDGSCDEGCDFKHGSILCMPIKNSEGETQGVIQLINKVDQRIQHFTQNDENFLEAFAIFCGMGIFNTHRYEMAVMEMAKQSVILDCLSYHATATAEDAKRLAKMHIPPAIELNLDTFTFDDDLLTDRDTIKACMRIFLDMDFVDHFKIRYEILCRWVLSVKKNYRHNVIYHNWRHAMNVTQTMYTLLTKTLWWKHLGELDCLALIIATLCHDLDHRGTDNAFQKEMSSPLAKLYSTSTLENHHFNHCVMILNSPDNNILGYLTSDEYRDVINVIEESILATDVANHFSIREEFFRDVEEHPHILYWMEDKKRSTLRKAAMTACDLSASAKPWSVQKRVVALLFTEYYQQGDLEIEKLHKIPVDKMNREKVERLPTLQIEFLTNICVPLYKAFTQLSSALRPLSDGCLETLHNWTENDKRSSEEVRSLLDDIHAKLVFKYEDKISHNVSFNLD